MPARSRGQVRSLRRESGQALVEFALILPLFLLIVVGIIQFGVGLNYWLDMQRIANQGARWAVVNKWPADPDGGGPELGMSGACLTDTTGQTDCSGQGGNFHQFLASEPVSGSLRPCVEITFPNGTKEVGDPVNVKLSVPFQFSPIVNLWTLKLTADATMRLEQKPGRYDNQTTLGGTSC